MEKKVPLRGYLFCVIILLLNFMYLVLSVSSKPNFKNPTGSISASVGSKGKARSTTQSAISDGILAVDGKSTLERIRNNVC